MSKAKPKPVTIAKAAATAASAGKITVKVKLTAAGKKMLKHAKKLKATAKGTFTPSGAAGVSAIKKFTLKR